MHFSYLVTVDVPQITPDPEMDKKIEEQIVAIEQDRSKEDRKDIVRDIILKELYGLRNEFARQVRDAIGTTMEPYSEQTEDPDYLIFEDHTEELREEYENETSDFIKLPEGTIVSENVWSIFSKFLVGEDGKVYQKEFGQLKHQKRSKRAKKMTGYKNYPFKKMYKTFEEFAAKESYYQYDEETKAYGYMYNPDAFWDWYQIGGRWPKMFLVKDTCTEYSIGERSWCNEDKRYEAPEGYMWVAAARKKDIEWQAHYEWNLQKETKFYHELVECFQKGKCPDDWYATITDDKITSWGDVLYVKDESLDEFLTRRKVTKDFPYQIFPYGYLHDYEYVTNESIELKDGKLDVLKDEDWYTKVKTLFDEADDDKVFVGVDCHS